MPNIASAPSVDGFKRTSFWREGKTGIITILSPGLIDNDLLDELIKIFSIAALDDNVKSIVLTGTNYVFSKGLALPPNRSYADLRDYYKRIQGIVLFLTSLEKPVFSAINGTAINNGVSLSLLADVVFYSDNTKLVLNDEEPTIFLGSITIPTKIDVTSENPNPIGIKVSSENTMGDIMKKVGDIQAIPYDQRRKNLFQNIETVLLKEEISFLDFYLWCEGCDGR
ncbi:MAG: enoyl-CoA hydratase/isomerase family protein [Thermoplasmatales archaeon]